MKRLLVLALAVVPCAVSAQTKWQWLVSDPTTVERVTHCVFTRGAVSTDSPVEVVTGGKRCKISIVNDPQTGTVTVAFKDAVLGDVGPSATFPFPSALPGVEGMRVVAN